MILETISGEIIGAIGSYFDLSIDLRFIDISEIQFYVPAYSNGTNIPFYDDIKSFHIIDLGEYGPYVIEDVQTSGDGIKETKFVKASSLEILLANRRIQLQQGTYPFYRTDDLASDNPCTIIGIIHSIIPDWQFDVDESLWSRYRTFDDTDTSVIDWMKNDAAKSFGCVFNFDGKTKTIYVLNADSEYDVAPVYLSYDNVIKQRDVEMTVKDFFTVLNVNGADGVNIREVNPIGENRIYNLDYFIENGDIPADLAAKWRDWQDEIADQQPLFTSLHSLRNAADARRIVIESQISDAESDVADWMNLMENATKSIAITQDEQTKEQLEALYLSYVQNRDIAMARVNTLQQQKVSVVAEVAAYSAQISAIVNDLKLKSYFTQAELDILSVYFIEDTFTDDTFAVFDVDVRDADGVTFESQDYESLEILKDKPDDVEAVDLSVFDQELFGNKEIFIIKGGRVSLPISDQQISGTVIAGTVELTSVRQDYDVVTCSLYLGKGEVEYQDRTVEFVNANITITGFNHSDARNTDSMFRIDLEKILSDEPAVSMVITRNHNQFESYAVQQELYDYAVEQHKSIAYPGIEFSLKSANFIESIMPTNGYGIIYPSMDVFKNKIRLGEGVYFDLGNGAVITPLLTEIHVNIDDPTDFNLVFSNTFKMHNAVKTMRDLLAEARSAARTLDMAKYNYGAYTRTGAQSEVEQLFTGGLDAATSQIIGGYNNSVLINGSGITIKDPTNPTSYIKLNNGMIAMMDGSNQAKLALGKFYDTGLGANVYGIVAPNIVGTLLTGQYLNIQSPKLDGTHMLFSVDQNGARLANGQFDIFKHYAQTDTYSKSISLDPYLGILAGNLDNAIEYSNGNPVGVYIASQPGSSQNAGSVTTIAEAADDQMFSNGLANLRPNFWVDLDGDVFMRGTVYATDGVFTGTVYATDGEFSGSLNAAIINGTLTANDEPAPGEQTADPVWIQGAGIRVGGNNYSNFVVDQNGNVTMNGGITLNGNITWGSGVAVPVTRDAIIQALEDAGSDVLPDGIYAYTYTEDGQQKKAIALNASYIKAGTISADRISAGTLNANNINTTGVFSFVYSGTTYGTMGQYSGTATVDGGTVLTYGTAMYGASNLFVVTVTDYGARMSDASSTHSVYVASTVAQMQATSSTRVTLTDYEASIYAGTTAAIRLFHDYNSASLAKQTWIYGDKIVLYGNSIVNKDGNAIYSDRSIKTDISYDMSKYEAFFRDIKPAFYHVVYGHSGRYHTGFVAQDIVGALIKNGLDTSDFAGYVLMKNYTEPDDEDAEPRDMCALRYEEFISLNTYMIQRLLDRIEALEKQIGGLE